MLLWVDGKKGTYFAVLKPKFEPDMFFKKELVPDLQTNTFHQQYSAILQFIQTAFIVPSL
jgi:hypothetical protein